MKRRDGYKAKRGTRRAKLCPECRYFTLLHLATPTDTGSVWRCRYCGAVRSGDQLRRGASSTAGGDGRTPPWFSQTMTG